MPKSYLIDMDGVIVSGSELIPGADAFIQRLQRRGSRFLILTNNSMFTPVDLQDRLKRLGIDLTPDHIYTSSLATASFLSQQRPGGTAFVLGETGLDEHSENTIMVGDRMDTDIRVGIESGMETVLVLTGVTSRDMVERFPYRPARILDSVAELEGD